MNYYIDTEFIEGFHKPLFGKRRHFIDLISIGIVCEDGRTYSAISNEYNYKDADEWVKQNVILPLYIETVHGDNRNHYDVNNFHKSYGKSHKQIAEEIVKFVYPEYMSVDYKVSHFDITTPDGIVLMRERGNSEMSYWMDTNYLNPKFYAYYADYDWVLFCSLFGRMIDLPKGFPMYCNDLKQILDEKANLKKWYYGRDIWSNTPNRNQDLQEDDYEASLEEKIEKIKSHDDYPKQENEHSALDDAKWNQKLHNFLKTL